MLSNKAQKVREKRIGSSEAAPALGLSIFASPIDVWKRLVLGEGLEDTADPKLSPLLRGNFLEDGTKDWYCHISGNKVRKAPPRVHPTYNWLADNCDFIIIDEDKKDIGCCEIKTSSHRMYHHWKEGPPEMYRVQAHIHMSTWNLPRCDMPVLLGDELRIYNIERDAAYEELILEGLRRFYEDYVVTGVEPPVDGSESYRQYLTEKFDRPMDTILEAGPETESMARDLAMAKRELKHHETRVRECENLLRASIGSATGLAGDNWRVMWRPVNGRRSVDWKSLARDHGISKEIIDSYAKEGKPYRRFMPDLEELC